MSAAAESVGFGVVKTRAWGFSDPAYGAKCASCGEWLTKYDDSAEDAKASAQDALRSHDCKGPKRRARR